MKISSKLYFVIIGNLLMVGIVVLLTVSSLHRISTIVHDNQTKHTPAMTTSLSLQNNIIQIQQFLTDISATKAKPGFDDGFQEAQKYYNLAKDNLMQLEKLGSNSQTIRAIVTDLDEYYQQGKIMANLYIKDGTDAGNAYMSKFDAASENLQIKVDMLLKGVQSNFDKQNSIIFNRIQLLDNNVILFGIAILIVCLLALFVIRNTILVRIRKITGILKNISEGDGDLSARIDIKSKDEIGIMAAYYNKFADSVSTIVSSVRVLSDQVSAASEELTAATQQSSATIDDLANNVTQISIGADEQVQSIHQCSDKLLKLGDLIENNKSQMDLLQKTSGEIEKLNEAGLKAIGLLANKTKESSDAVEGIHQNIIKTSQSSDKISEASNLIAMISSQTNLLSLNASIEAARAGENGKGFAVVADEIRKLAEQSSEATKTIDSMVQNLQQNSADTVKSMLEVDRLLKEEIENVNITGNSFREIAGAMKSSSTIVEIVFELGNQSQSMNKEVQHTLELVSEIAQKNQESVSQASAAIQEQAATALEIAKASEGLSKNSDELHSGVEIFKL